MSIKTPPEKKAWFDAQRAELRELLAKEKKPVDCETPTAVCFSGARFSGLNTPDWCLALCPPGSFRITGFDEYDAERFGRLLLHRYAFA